MEDWTLRSRQIASEPAQTIACRHGPPRDSVSPAALVISRLTFFPDTPQVPGPARATAPHDKNGDRAAKLKSRGAFELEATSPKGEHDQTRHPRVSLLGTVPGVASRPMDLMESLFTAERVLVPYRDEVRERAFSRARCGPGHRPTSFATVGRWALRPRQAPVVAGVLLALVSVAGAALEVRRRLERPSKLFPTGAGARPVGDWRGGTWASLPATAPWRLSSRAGVRSLGTSTRTEEYGRELRILEPARRAFARGDFAVVISAADEHARMFPSSGLAEERDAMRVHALFRQGRIADARRAAIKFRKDFPSSAVLGQIYK